MRTILFKAKKLSDGKWVKGSLVKTPFGTFIEWYEDSVCNKEEVDSSTVCQFIGLTDCEGNEVWEGDIIKNHDFPFEKRTVTWANCLSCFIPIDEDGGQDRHLSLLVLFKKWTVVGNKFDRKEGEK